MIKTNADEIRAEFAPLYSRYSGQVNPQPAHIEINPEQQGMVAEFNPEIGNAVPMNVWHGRAYRVSISPYYTGKQVAEILENVDFQNMAQRVFDGYSCAYDGSNHNGRLTDDAKAALEEMERFLQEMDQYLNVSDSGVSVYAPEDWFSELPDLAGKSDDELSTIADQFRTEAESDNVCIDGDILRFLKDRRDGI